MVVASTPLLYNNFSLARLLKFCQHAIPIFLTLYYNFNGFAILNTTSNSVLIILVYFLSSTLLNLLVSVIIITILEELRPINSMPITLIYSPLYTIPTLSATFLADLLCRKLRQQCTYKASALPILCSLESAGACSSYELLML